MKNVIQNITDFIFPKTSIITGDLIEDSNSNQYINDNEFALLEKVTEKDLCELKAKLKSDYSFSVFSFREGDSFSNIIYNLKYGGMKNLGIFLGILLGNEIGNFIQANLYVSFDCIIPVALHKTKFRERGYNQTEMICRGINGVLKLKSETEIIIRKRNTLTQTKLNKKQRMENIKDAFHILPEQKSNIAGKNIILIDDVITTGSTMNEIIRVLREGNCGRILACSLAMARD